jgi:hypothetical protein
MGSNLEGHDAAERKTDEVNGFPTTVGLDSRGESRSSPAQMKRGALSIARSHELVAKHTTLSHKFACKRQVGECGKPTNSRKAMENIVCIAPADGDNGLNSRDRATLGELKGDGDWCRVSQQVRNSWRHSKLCAQAIDQQHRTQRISAKFEERTSRLDGSHMKDFGEEFSHAGANIPLGYGGRGGHGGCLPVRLKVR